MEMKGRLKKQIENVRGLSDGLLGAFQTPEQWVHQVDPAANHALWFAGHMGVSDNFFISMLDASRAQEKVGFSEAFGMGSQPVSDPSAYPPVEEVLAYMRERRSALLDVIDGMSEEDLAKPTPEGTPEMWPDLGSVLETVVWHEGLHAGQVSVARRSLGNQPLFGAGPEE